MRAEQGLDPADVVVEFRLLRQEIWHALRERLPDHLPTSDVIGAELLVNDAIDGAISVGLTALTARIETAREDFFATTVHEVRQPLATIKGSAQFAARMLSRPGSNTAQILDELHRIEAGADRMAAHVSTLVDVSRVALGRLELSRRPVDLLALLREAVGRLGAEEIARVRLPGNDTPMTGEWDAERVEQVLTNLLSNALKYSPAGTPVDVSVHGDTAEAVLMVRDYGIGISAGDLPRLFRRYARSHDAIARGVDGLGLGLYLCRGIVEAHGGRIWAESRGPGEGTTLHVVLPRRTTGNRE
jgi:signal transduction histidine kinase